MENYNEKYKMPTYLIIIIIGLVILVIGLGGWIINDKILNNNPNPNINENDESNDKKDTEQDEEKEKETKQDDEKQEIDYKAFINSGSKYIETIKKEITLNNKKHELAFVYSVSKNDYEQNYNVVILFDNKLISNNLSNISILSDELDNNNFVSDFKTLFSKNLTGDIVKIIKDNNNKQYLLLQTKNFIRSFAGITYRINIVNDEGNELYYGNVSDSSLYYKPNGDLFFEKHVDINNNVVTIYKVEHYLVVSVENGKANIIYKSYPDNLECHGGC